MCKLFIQEFGECRCEQGLGPLSCRVNLMKHFCNHSRVYRHILPFGCTKHGSRYGWTDDEFSSPPAQTSDGSSNIRSLISTESARVQFVLDHRLRFLLPQFISSCYTLCEARKEISQLIFLFANDLQESVEHYPTWSCGPTSLRVSASKLVQRERNHLAHEICDSVLRQGLGIGETGLTTDSTQQSYQETILVDYSSFRGDEGLSLYDFLTVRAFLFYTEPFKNFCKDVQRAVEKHYASPLPARGLVFYRKKFHNTLSRIWRPPVRAGFTRLSWNCVSS